MRQPLGTADTELFSYHALMLSVAYFFSALIVMVTLIWAAVFRNGVYFSLLALSLFARIGLIGVNEIFAIFPNDALSEYVPYFQAFASDPSFFNWLFGARVYTYTAFYSGMLYGAFGDYALIPIYVTNAAVSTVSLYFVIRLQEVLFVKPNSSSLYIFSFWPPWLRYSIELGRTPPSVFLTCMTVFYFTVIFIRRRFSAAQSIAIMLFLFASVLLILVRPAHLAIPASLLLVAALIYPRDCLSKLAVSAVASALVLLSVQIYNLIAPEMQQASLATIAERAATDVRGATAYLSGVHPSTFLDLFWYLPVHGIYFLFSPLPWHAFAATNPLAYLSAVFSAIFAAAAAFLLPGVYRLGAVRKQLFASLIFGLLFSALIMGSGVKNAGAAERYSLPITLILVMLSTAKIKIIIGPSWKSRRAVHVSR